MPINHNCSHCQKEFTENKYVVGTDFKCPHCGEKTTAVPCMTDESESGPDDNSADLENIKTYMLPALAVTLFCCLPFGIVALVFAAQTNAYREEKNVEAARRYSNLAQTWVGNSIIFGMLLLFFLLLLLVQISK